MEFKVKQSNFKSWLLYLLALHGIQLLQLSFLICEAVATTLPDGVNKIGGQFPSRIPSVVETHVSLLLSSKDMGDSWRGHGMESAIASGGPCELPVPQLFRL